MRNVELNELNLNAPKNNIGFFWKKYIINYLEKDCLNSWIEKQIC